MKAQPTSNDPLSNDIAVDKGAKESDNITVTIFTIYLAISLWYAYEEWWYTRKRYQSQ